MSITSINFDAVFWNNTVRSYLVAAGIILVISIIVRILKAVTIGRLRAWAERTRTSLDDFLVRGLNRTVLPLLYFMGVYAGLSYLTFPPPFGKALEVVFKIIVVFFVVRMIVSTISYFLRAYLIKQENGEEKIRQMRGLMIIVNVVIWCFGLVFLLSNLGYDVTAIIAGLGIGGIAIALAAQTILGDLFSYFVIFFDRPFEIGDFIVVDDKSGTVEYVGIKTTRLKSLGGEQLVFSNTDLTNSRLHNYKRMERRRVVFKLGVIYETPESKLKLIPGLIKSIIENQEDVLFDRAHFSSYEASSLDFEVCYYVLSSDYTRYMDIQQHVNFRIMEEFEKLDIGFAYPTQTLYLPELEKSMRRTEKPGDRAGKDESPGA